MQIIKRKEKIGNILFTIGILLELLIMMTDHSAITLPLRGRVAQVAFVLFGCKILTTDYSKKQWIFIILAGILGCISYFTCDDEYIIRAVVFIIATKDIDIKRIAKLIFTGAIFGTMLIILLAFTNVLGNMVDVRNYGRGMVEARWNMGFSHANNLHDMLWFLVAYYVFIKEKSCNIKHYVALTIFNILLYTLTLSRNGFLAVQIVILTAFIFLYFPKLANKNFPYILGAFSFIMCTCLTFLAGISGIETNRVVAFFDRFLTYRLEMVWEYAPISSWRLFPGPRSLSYVDNGFASLFFYYGIIVGIFYLLYLSYMFFCCYRQKNTMVLIILVTAVFVSFVETTFIFNTSLLCNPVFLMSFVIWQMQSHNKGREIV